MSFGCLSKLCESINRNLYVYCVQSISYLKFKPHHNYLKHDSSQKMLLYSKTPKSIFLQTENDYQKKRKKMEKKNVIRLIFSPLVVKHIICARRMKWEKNKERSESTKLDSISDSHPASVYISIPRVILLAHKQKKKTIDFFFILRNFPSRVCILLGGGV